ncbi:hypothetical protein HHUSO_G12204, partial [Huso huso]
DQYKLKAVEEVKYMRSGDEDGVTARNQENLVRGERRGEEHRCLSLSLSYRLHSIHTSESQQEFFRMLDEKIEKVRAGKVSRPLQICV